MISIKVEPLEQAFQDSRDTGLAEEHYYEVCEHRDKIKFQMAWGYFLDLEKKGASFICVVRNDGRMVGYALFTFHTTLKSGDLPAADCFALFLDQKYRGKGISKQLIEVCEDFIYQQGVRQIFWPVRPQRNYGWMLEEAGYFISDIIYTKYLERN